MSAQASPDNEPKITHIKWNVSKTCFNMYNQGAYVGTAFFLVMNDE